MPARRGPRRTTARRRARRAARGAPSDSAADHTMRFSTCRSRKWPSSCASTASISSGASRSSSVSKNTMRLARPKPVKNALPWLERREPSITKSPLLAKPQRASSASIALARRPLGQRRELVEERGDHAWVEHQHQQLERHPRAPTPTATTAAPAARISHSTSAASGRPSDGGRPRRPSRGRRARARASSG